MPVPEPCEHLKEVRCHLLVLVGRIREASSRPQERTRFAIRRYGNIRWCHNKSRRRFGEGCLSPHSNEAKHGSAVCVVPVWYGPDTRRRQCHLIFVTIINPGCWRLSESEVLPPPTGDGTVLYAVNQKVIYERYARCCSWSSRLWVMGKCHGCRCGRAVTVLPTCESPLVAPITVIHP